ncbi:VOC family protein [Pseudidiomarina gelatinasegens]|uniref:VOC family protein n=1 Tax=Pseudidiomarina gelatinasegens TaxID=2487740 RepID=A0A443Z6G8_9GAMM|nr:VOC family protein [Pseudidiomarina gelatinasegens]RWU12391.1 VOC family protein [Pseudidiomarina gelatinasegens]
MTHEKINYIELPARDIEATKAFFTDSFGWTFVDYGPDYAAIENAGLDGGFYRSDLVASTTTGSALIVLYSKALEASQTRVEETGGKIIKAIFDFPGGRRFHFTCPSGNEYAVWSDVR